MCVHSGAPNAEATMGLDRLDVTTLRALSDAGYVDAAAYRERARQLGVNVSTTVIPVRQPLPSMALRRRPETPQTMGFI